MPKQKAKITYASNKFAFKVQIVKQDSTGAMAVCHNEEAYKYPE